MPCFPGGRRRSERRAEEGARKERARKEGAEKKEPEKKEPEVKAPDTIKLGTYVGKVLAIDEAKHTIKIELTLQEINPDAVRGMEEAQRELAAAQFDNNFQSRIQKIQAANNKYAQPAGPSLPRQEAGGGLADHG